MAIKSDERRARQEAAGIPDSKPSAAPHAELTGVDRLLVAHINGVQISELNLDPQVLGALDYWQTDEGIAEKNARPDVREWAGHTAVGRDGFDKSLEQRRDDVMDRDMSLYESRDPLKEVADRYAVPGQKAKFLSAAKIKDGGTSGDYSIVKDAAGDPVRVRGMVLGHMPVERAAAKTKFFREKGNSLLKAIGDTYKKEGGATAVTDQ
jgi:hypothetical protein